MLLERSCLFEYLADFQTWGTGLQRSKSYAPDRRFERPEEIFGGSSTYNQDFHTHSSKPRNPIKPVANDVFDSVDGFSDMTSNRRDFIRHPLPVKQAKTVKEYAPNRIPLDSMTTMKMDYTAKEPIRMQSFKPVGGSHQSEDPFVGSTTQKDDFPKWAVQPKFPPKDKSYVQPLGEMDMNTNYSRDFVGVTCMPATAIRPQPRQKNEAAFEGQTTYVSDFIKQSQGRREPIKNANEFAMPDGPFEGKTTYKSEFYGTRGTAAKTTKIDSIYQKPNDPFDSQTSYRQEYTRKARNHH